MSAVNVRYGLYPGDRLMVTAGKKKKRATVVKEYPFHILMDKIWNGYSFTTVALFFFFPAVTIRRSPGYSP